MTFDTYSEQEYGAKKPSKLRRAKSTLTRPERNQSIKRKPLVADNKTRIADNFARQREASDQQEKYLPSLYQESIEEEEEQQYDWWMYLVSIVTCCFPNIIAGKLIKSNDKATIWAWKEKLTLIFIVILACCFMAFVIFGIQILICQPDSNRRSINDPPTFNAFAIHGQWYALSQQQNGQLHPSANQYVNSSSAVREISSMFPNSFDTSACDSVISEAIPNSSQCQVSGGPNYCHSAKLSDISQYMQPYQVSFEWSDVNNPNNDYVVFNGEVLDVSRYMQGGVKFLGDQVHNIIVNNLNQDISRLILNSANTQDRAQCLSQLYKIGYVSKQSIGCFASVVINWIILVVVLGLVFVRFVMAIIYSWTVAPRLAQAPKDIPYLPPSYQQSQFKAQKNKYQSLQTLQSPRKSIMPKLSRYSTQFGGSPMVLNRKSSLPIGIDYKNIDPELLACFVMILVTVYSEGEEEIRKSLTSIAETDYPNRQKLIFMVADGLITGGGNSQSTPDICKNLLTLNDEDPPLLSYVAIADGQKQHNLAKIYVGTFDHDEVQVPTILIVKCGTAQEQNDPKPGNRGKRDSQIILMNFLSKVMFDDRMTPLEYDLFNKITFITGVYPDRFEIVLMVDADTKVYKDSLSKMVNAMRNDTKLMGVCGETRLANPNQSWVTMIQVYEYFISHHLVKNFESLFGGVTCLPGCFSAYRIKAPKGDQGYWVPILANPDIVEEYSQNVVNTLHKKNLLLLGEDRFLSTLMLKTFPKRQMIFLPQAQCETVVPDKFSVLLSQRRRWINSTVHNLAELVFVKDLCGTFCISMQFVILLDLFGTIVLPAAIIFTIILIVGIANPATSFVQDSVLPLVTLLMILILPSFLIFFLTARRSINILYMFVYLVALPVWNFILPVYAFWHFDDFTWGATRQINGSDQKEKDHGKKVGKFDGLIEMKRWSEWDALQRKSQANSPIAVGSQRTLQALVSPGQVSFPKLDDNFPRKFSLQNHHLQNSRQQDSNPNNPSTSSRSFSQFPSDYESIVSYNTSQDYPPSSQASSSKLQDISMKQLDLNNFKLTLDRGHAVRPPTKLMTNFTFDDQEVFDLDDKTLPSLPRNNTGSSGDFSHDWFKRY